MSRAEKLATLANYINILRVSVIDQGRKDEVEIKAAALARELFPPMAKALVWELTEDGWRSGQFRIVNSHGDIWWVTHPDMCSFRSDLADAKALAESHHQAKFKEQLA